MAQILQHWTVCQWIRLQANSAKFGRVVNHHALQRRSQSTNVIPKSEVKIQGSNPSVDEPAKKSKSQKKREAQRAVRWGMRLAKLSPLHLKRIMRVACLEDEIFDAVMLAKKLGPDGREARRRQFNYIGGLLRKVQPEVMEAVIQASKDGDMDIFHGVPGKVDTVKEEVELEGEESEEEEMDEEVLSGYMEIAKRWSEGLISGDVAITKEVYSIYNIDFDRQELRKLVRELRTNQGSQKLEETEVDEADCQARKKALDNFLCRLAQQYCINPS